MQISNFCANSWENFTFFGFFIQICQFFGRFFATWRDFARFSRILRVSGRVRTRVQDCIGRFGLFIA
uniref:Uncharacterized protein n=1 Tax=Bursaphelenchus xylophilus TaxID=6326 RepID=A0A1I7S0P7_BURXY